MQSTNVIFELGCFLGFVFEVGFGVGVPVCYTYAEIPVP